MSGSSEIQTVDEVMMAVIGMGFSLEDAQEAIQAGHVQAEAIVNWILSGKPQVQQRTTPSLRLGPGAAGSSSDASGGLSFSNPPLPVKMDTTPSPPDPDKMEIPPEQQVVSRVYLSEDARKEKESFEEKRRLEVQRLARKEKIESKKAKDLILAQIKEDRENAKMRNKPHRAEGGATGTAAGAAGAGAAGTPAEAAAAAVKKSNSSVLQVRLPSGQAKRETFAADATLRHVWTSFIQRHTDTTNMALIQPFPRKEFSDSDMDLSLSELGLVPNGSLALKKKEANQSVASPPEGAVSEEEKEENMVVCPPPQPPQGPAVPPVLPPPGIPPTWMPGGAAAAAPAPPSHQWGAGHPLLPGEVGDDGDEDTDEEMDDEEQDPMQPQNPQHPGLPQNLPFPPMAGGGFGGGFGGGGAGGGFGGGGENHFWGMGNALQGEVLEPENLPHHQQDARQLAAEAARQRHNRPAPPQPQQQPQAQTSHTNLLMVPSLQSLMMAHISERICDTRRPITGLHHLPLELAMDILAYLKHEHKLRPKTLMPFISCCLNRLSLDCYPLTTNELLHAIRLHPYIVTLSLRSSPLITDKGLQPLTALKRLKTLSLASCPQLTDNCISVIKEFSRLTNLCLEGTGITDSGIQHLCSGSPHPCELRVLDLSRTAVSHATLTALPAASLQALVMEGCQNLQSLSGIEQLTNVRTLNVASTRLSSDSMICLSQLHALHTLNIANIEGMNGDTALKHISGLRLQKLILPNRLTTTDAGMQYLVNMPLRMLDLTNYINVGDAGMESVGKILSLEVLLLSNTKVGDAGVVFLEGLKELKELQLDRTAISNVGAAIVKAFPNLDHLSLSETCIGDGFLKNGGLDNCLQISKLNLARTNISDKGLKHLRLPQLRTMHLHGTYARNFTLPAHFTSCPQLQSVIYQQLRTPPRSEDEGEN